MKGIDIVVGGSVGHSSCFMAQAGNLVVCGDADEALGDSLYETRIFVRGRVAGLGADCIEKPMRDEHLARWPSCWRERTCPVCNPKSSAAMGRRASFTTSR